MGGDFFDKTVGQRNEWQRPSFRVDLALPKPV